MSEVLGLKTKEWLSLVIIGILLGSLVFVIQKSTSKTINLKEKPSFETSIGSNVLKNPLAVAINNEKIAVTNSEKGEIEIFSRQGQEISSIKMPKKSYPASLVFDKNGSLFIGDIANGAIYKIPAIGTKKIKKIKIKQKFKPLAMTFQDNQLIIFDSLNQKIRRLSKSLKLEDFVRKKNIKISYANGIFSNKDSLYASDSNSQRVLRFNKNGRFLGALKGFNLPRGIAVDSLQRIHVVDTFAHTVKVYNSEGKFLFNYGKEGSSEGQLYLPNGLAIDSIRGKVYVADKGNNRLQVWSW